MSITIQSHGTLLVATNFWGTPEERAGDFVLSYSAGCFRLLVPQSHQAIVSAIASVEELFVTRCLIDGTDSFLIQCDGDDSLVELHISADRCVPLPDDSASSEVTFAVYTAPRRGGKPHKSLERAARYSRAE